MSLTYAEQYGRKHKSNCKFKFAVYTLEKEIVAYGVGYNPRQIKKRTAVMQSASYVLFFLAVFPV